jgi:hydrogenase 3 maturation protease
MDEVIEQEIKAWLSNAERVVIAGIGNPLRRDDYVGLKIVEDLRGKLSQKVLLLECETVPESYLLDIEEFKPTHVLLVDAAYLDLKPGGVRLVDAEEVVNFSSITTHLLPLRIFCEYVKQATGAKTVLLLVEPKSVDFGEGLSIEVQAAAERLTKVLIALLG